ncbi:Fanconi anemia group G protein-like [Branchiostoma floridae x Branchiostoma japonicum]
MQKNQPSFLQRWTTDNNRLVSQYLTEDHDTALLQSEFQRLVKEIQGLPPRVPSLCVELPVVFNLCYLQYTSTPQGGADQLDLSTTICGALQRALGASQSGQAVLTVERLLTSDPDVTVLLKHVLQLAQGSKGTAIVEPVCLLATLLSLCYLGHQRDRAIAVLQIVKECRTQTSSESGERAAAAEGCALRPHLIPSSVLGTDDLLRPVRPPVPYLLSCCLYLDGNIAGSLQELESQTAEQPFLPASYLKGFVLFGYVLFGEKRYEESILALQACLNSPSSDMCTKARVLNLMGCCCAQQGKLHTSIQLFREALRCDFSHHSALYNISLQYQALGLGDVELETLNLLVTALEGKDLRKDSCKNQVLDPVLQLDSTAPGTATLLTSPHTCILLHQALYVLAKRCLELERYEAAAQRYVDLLATVLDTSVLQPSTPGSPFPPLDLQTVYCKAALALLKAQRYEDAIAVCDKLLTKMPPNNQWQTDTDPSHDSFSLSHNAVHSSHDSLKLVEDPVTPPSNRCDSGDDLFDSNEDSEERTAGKKMSKKRAREPSEQEGMQCVEQNTEVKSVRLKSVLPLMYKAEALYRLEEYQEAVICYDRLLKVLFDVTPEEPDTDKKIDRKTDSTQPTQKRRRTEEGFLPIVPDSASTSKGSEGRRKLLLLKSEAYQNKGLILIGQEKLQAALQCLRLSVQSNPGES